MAGRLFVWPIIYIEYITESTKDILVKKVEYSCLLNALHRVLSKWIKLFVIAKNIKKILGEHKAVDAFV